MGERQKRAEDMAGTSTAVTTIAPQSQKEESSERVAVITLRPTATGSRKKVVWTEDTVDNEGMNKKKSKCCCIYEKPRKFGESDSEDSEDECEHCYGHVERRTHRHHHEQPPEVQPPGAADAQDSAVEPTVSIQLSSEPAPAPAPAPPDKADPAGSAS